MVESIQKMITQCLSPASCKLMDFEKTEEMKISFAVIMWAMIIADGTITEQEIKKLYEIFSIEFTIDADETDTIIRQLQSASHNIDLHAKNISDAISANPTAKMMFLKYLNSLMTCDQTKEVECRIFEKIKDLMLKA